MNLWPAFWLNLDMITKTTAKEGVVEKRRGGGERGLTSKKTICSSGHFFGCVHGFFGICSSSLASRSDKKWCWFAPAIWNFLLNNSSRFRNYILVRDVHNHASTQMVAHMQNILIPSLVLSIHSFHVVGRGPTRVLIFRILTDRQSTKTENIWQVIGLWVAGKIKTHYLQFWFWLAMSSWITHISAREDPRFESQIHRWSVVDGSSLLPSSLPQTVY